VEAFAWRGPGMHLNNAEAAMRLLIILSSANPEVQWNAFRFGNMALNEGDDVSIFLNGPAVNLRKGDSTEFPLLEQAKVFTLSEGRLAA